MGAAKFLLACLCVLLGMGGRATRADGSEVVVVYNSRMPVSKKVAEYYAEKRQVPTNQVLSFALPEVESMSREEFERNLQQPLWNELKKRELLTYRESAADPGTTLRCNVTDAKIRYVVLCYGVPLKVAPDNTRNDPQGDKLPQELRRNEAAVESELTLLPYLDQRLPIVGAQVNNLLNATNRAMFHPTNGVLMVTRIDGPSPEIAMGLVDKALEAEQSGLFGNVYVDMRGITEPGMKQADDMMKATGELGRLYGFNVVTEDSNRTFGSGTPLPNIAFYVGWYEQSVSGPFTNGMAQFRPGAFAYHLHSFSSRHLRVNDVWWTGPLLKAGATATMGCTEEPYLQATPLMNSFFYRFVQLGFTYGEAALASQPWLSWQIAVVGDPLDRPFAKNQKERFQELMARNDKNLEWSLLMWVNFLQAQNASLDEILKFYSETPPAQTSAIMQEELGDVFKAKGKLFDAVGPYAKALEGNLSSLQRLQLIMKAAPLFSSMGRAEQAYALYQEVLKEHPDYPGKKVVYEKLAELAAKLKKTDEAAEYQKLAR